MKKQNKVLKKAIKFLLTHFSSISIGNPNEFLYSLAVSPNDDYDNFKKNYKYRLWVSLNDTNSYEHIEQKTDDNDNNIIGIFKVNGDLYSASWRVNSYDDHTYDNILSTFKKVKPNQKMITVYEVNN